MKSVWQYLKNLAIWLDQGFNTLLLGHPDETLSSRSYRAWRGNKIFGRITKPLIDWIFFFETDHCFNSYLSEIKRRQLPPEFRDENN